MARTIAIDLVGRDMLSKSLVAAAESTKALKRSLEELNKRVNVGVDADTGKARAELAAAKAEADRLDGKKADVKVNADAGAAMAAIQSVGMALAGLAAIPVGATLGAGVLALVPSFAAAGIGAAGLAAVAVPAISDIKAALQAQTQAQAHSGAAAVASQSKALAMAGAQQQVASAVRQAAYAHVQALQQVQQAEQSLTQAQQGAVQAQRDLVQARKDAAKQLQDQANNSADAQLAERQATFDLTDAQTNYNKVASNPASTKDQIARAKLVLDQARQNLKERHLATERAIADEKAGAKAGVEGSDAVRQARLKLAQANQQVANAEKSLAQARAGVARADRQSADAVASARRGLTAASLQGAGASNALNAAMAKLSPSARNLMGHWTGLKGAFDSWRKSMEPTVLPIFGRALDMLKGQIPSLTPIVKGAAGAVNGLVTDLGKNAKSPFWSQFKKNLTALVPTALTGFGKTAGNVATGLAGVINAFLPYAPSLLDWIVKISGKFATWGKGLGGSNQVSKFMDYVRTNGPKIWETVQNIAKAAVHLVTALSGSGGDTLSGIVGISKALAGLSPGQIQALAAAFVTFKAAQAGVEGAKSLGAIPDQIKEAKDQITGFASGAKSAWNAVSSGATKSAQMLGRVRDGFRSTQAAESAFSGRAGSLGGVLRKSLNAAGSGWGKLVDGAKGAGTAVAGASTKILAAGKAAASAALDLGKMAAGYVLTGLKAAWSAIQLVAVKVAQLAVKAATAAWAAIQWVLDAALSANPIGLVVIAIVALVAAVVYAYTHFTWFKNAVDAAWKGIVAVFMWAWDTVIKPIFNIYKWYILNIMVPYFKLLWATAKLIWAGIAEVIHLYWTYYIKPVFNLIKWFIINVVIAYFKMLWSAAKTIWNGISSAISFVWNNGIKPVFNAIKSAVGVVQTAFRTAVDGIRRIWDGLKGIARTPVNFVIGIFNAGIVNLVNRIASFAGIKAHLNAIPKLAAGGTLDNPARVGPMKTRGPMAIVGEGRRQYPEYVIPTDPKFRGRAQGLWAAAGRDLSGGGRGRKWLSGPDALGGEGMGFAHGGTIPQLAGGGIIGGFIKGLKNFAFGNVEKAAKAVLDQVTGGSIPGSGMFRDAIAAVPGWIKDKVLGWVKAKVGMGAGGPGMAGALNWAKSQSGKPYSWGGVGPAGYDCSGFMSAITNVIHGKSPYSRMFSTHSFGSTGGPGGFVRNQRSGFMVGVTNAGVGHMAGTLLGTNVESNGSQGVHYGPGARGFNDPLFGYQYGLKADTGALTLRPGWNPPTYNGTGKPELLTAAPPTAAPIVLEITPSGSRGLDALFLEWLRNAIRIKGGDVQTVLGQ